MKAGNVGSRKQTPDGSELPGTRPDEYRVQRSSIANLWHYDGTGAFRYHWTVKGATRWSRVYNTPTQLYEAMRRQGFGAYRDQDGLIVRL